MRYGNEAGLECAWCKIYAAIEHQVEKSAESILIACHDLTVRPYLWFIGEKESKHPANLIDRQRNSGGFCRTSQTVGWADKIFVMEERHHRFLEKSFATVIHDKEIVCLNIPDIFDYMDPALIRLLREGVEPHLEGE